MMKMKAIFRILLTALLLLCMLACAVACDGGDKNNNNGESNGSENTSIFAVTYKGVTIELGKDAEQVLEALGAPKASQKIASCGENMGDQWRYEYASLYLFTVKNGKEETVDAVILRDDTPTTTKNITIGSTEAQMTAAYGEPRVDGKKCRYTEGNKTLECMLDDAGKIKEIQLRVES